MHDTFGYNNYVSHRTWFFIFFFIFSNHFSINTVHNYIIVKYSFFFYIRRDILKNIHLSRYIRRPLPRCIHRSLFNFCGDKNLRPILFFSFFQLNTGRKKISETTYLSVNIRTLVSIVVMHGICFCWCIIGESGVFDSKSTATRWHTNVNKRKMS